MYTPLRENLCSIEDAKLNGILDLVTSVGNKLFPVYQKYDIYKKQQEARKRLEREAAERLRINKLIAQQERLSAQTSVGMQNSGGAISSLFANEYAPYILGGLGLGLVILLKKK
jgi:hypothetical protein